jgi:hypothetical protein
MNCAKQDESIQSAKWDDEIKWIERVTTKRTLCTPDKTREHLLHVHFRRNVEILCGTSWCHARKVDDGDVSCLTPCRELQNDG